MNKLKYIWTGDEMTKQSVLKILALSQDIKENPNKYQSSLKGKQVVLSFEKPSLRTRLSFSSGINALGGSSIESVSSLRKKEAPKDFIRAVQCYADAIMLRTFDDLILSELVAYSEIPIINGLSNDYHPCQSLADLMTLQDVFGQLDGLTVTYIGDANNVFNSLLLLCNKLNITVRYCCPKGHGPKKSVLSLLQNKEIVFACENPTSAVEGSQAVYTDVWTSMGFEESPGTEFSGFQVNENLMSKAESGAVFMHCMPMNRGEEVSETLPDSACSVVFQQCQNRLFVQQALLVDFLL